MKDSTPEGVLNAARRGRDSHVAKSGCMELQHMGAHSSVPFSLRRRVFFDCVASVMEGTTNLVVYRNGEIIQNTHEGVRFVCQNLFSFVVPCTMMLMELQNGLCQSMENGMLTRVSIILYRNPVIVFGGLIQFDIVLIIDEAKVDEIQNDLDIEDDRVAVYEGMNTSDEDEDGDVGVKAAAENVVVHLVVSQPMNVPPFMCNLDLDAMNAPKFLEHANIGVTDPEDGEFRIRMEYSSRKSVVAAIRNYTISRGVDYNVYESEAQTFYAKCKMYGRGCDWLIRASLI
ncbi:hypothetical protein Ahy_B03g064400 [Arachis hypogaea]|uniref:Transposase MuDR plant domain-containing protein n=1 Tax=Arachis hypogaea TaxID=3818 RepID=A0A444ZZH9_ARAHY|nr:hypothetical protein Ahy_B03g064400 [Arachis hypogaea]